MPVDDLLLWAAETRSYGPRSRNPNDEFLPQDESPCSEFQSVVGRPPSPAPKRGKLPRWYDIGHCAAACSNRCSLHASFPNTEPQNRSPCDTDDPLDIVNQSPSPSPAPTPITNRHRHHHRQPRTGSGNGDASPDFHSGPTGPAATKSLKKLDRRYRNSRLEYAREQLLNGNVHIARAIVAEELDRLAQSEAK